MAKDGEGNSYSPCSDFWEGKYRAETTWDGEVGLESLSKEEMEHGYGEEDVMIDGEFALILCPVN